MDLSALASRVARRWWVIAALAALAVVGAVTASAGSSEEQRTTIRFVLRPDTSVSNDDLPGALQALNSDGTLVQTVLGVLRDRSMLRRAATDANVALTPAYSLEATLQPGSTLIESTVTGPDGSAIDGLAAAYAREASIYVAASYPAYALERLGTDHGAGGSGPGGVQIIVLALLVGATLGVALVAAELRLEPHFKGFGGPRAAAASPAEPAPEGNLDPAPEPEPESNGRPDREPPAAAPPSPAERDEPAAVPPEPAPEDAEREHEPASERQSAAPLRTGAPPKRSGPRAPARPARPPRPPVAPWADAPKPKRPSRNGGTADPRRFAPMRHKDKG
jgi:hypothetical protein